MSAKTGIQWTDATWNPGVYGCDEVSPGCAHCYAVPVAYRLERMGQAPYAGLTRPVPAGGRTWTGEVRVSRESPQFSAPLRWRKPRRVFVNSMSDLFHEDVPDEHLDAVWRIMRDTPQHTYQVLTKRPERMLEYVSRLDLQSWLQNPLPNVWLGVSAEDQPRASARVPLLLNTPAAVRFVSFEPALEAVDFAPWLGEFLIDWIIVGGESGPGARFFHPGWARDVIAQGDRTATAVFVKQLGSGWAHRHNDEVRRGYMDAIPIASDAHGADMRCWPEDLRVREFPRA